MKQNSTDEILALFRNEKFDRILVACHQNPDGDAVGSAYALAYALRLSGKKARAFCTDRIGNDFAYITRAEEHNEPFEPENVIAVDTASVELLGAVDFADKIRVVIDHHLSSTIPASVRLVCPERASCGEIVLGLIREMGVEFDSYLALALYTAIITDTGCFRYSNTDENTFLSAAFLSRYAAKSDFYRITKSLFETKSKKKLTLEAFAVQNVRYEAGGRIALLLVTNEDMARLGAQFPELDGMINVIRQAEGVKVSVVIKQKEARLFKVSVRAEEGFNASDFCTVFGGGGHRAAAGCSLEGEANDVKNRLLDELLRRMS